MPEPRPRLFFFIMAFASHAVAMGTASSLRGLSSEASSLPPSSLAGETASTNVTAPPSMPPSASSSSGTDNSFLMFATFIVGFIVIAYAICMVQMVRLWCCKCFRQEGEDTTSAAAAAAHEDTVLYHEGRVLSLTGRQRRAVLEAIFSEASKAVTETDVSPKKRKKRGKSADFYNKKNGDEEEGAISDDEIPANVEIPNCSTAGTVTSNDSNSVHETTKSNDDDEEKDAQSHDKREMTDDDDNYSQESALTDDDSQQEDDVAAELPVSPKMHRKQFSQESVPTEDDSKQEDGAAAAADLPMTPRRQRKQIESDITNCAILSEEEEVHIYEDSSVEEENEQQEEPNGAKEPSQASEMKNDKESYNDLGILRTYSEEAESPQRPLGTKRIARAKKATQQPLENCAKKAPKSSHVLFPYRRMQSLDSDHDVHESEATPEDLILPNLPTHPSEDDSDGDDDDVGDDDNSDEETVKASGESAHLKEETNSSSSVDSAALAVPFELDHLESFTTCSASEYTYDDDTATDENVCSICLNGYAAGDTLIVSKYCSHIFHKDCILEWLEKRDECPICRVDMVTQEQMSKAATSIVGQSRMDRAVAARNESGANQAAMNQTPPRTPRPRGTAAMLAASAFS